MRQVLKTIYISKSNPLTPGGMSGFVFILSQASPYSTDSIGGWTQGA
ncbi:hypothetical protein [Porphyromonas pogonae]|nr:hypothetical protein [Porphyromonas pogonae]